MLALMEHQGRVPAATATAARTMPLGVVRRRAAATADSGSPYFAEEVRRQLARTAWASGSTTRP